MTIFRSSVFRCACLLLVSVFRTGMVPLHGQEPSPRDVLAERAAAVLSSAVTPGDPAAAESVGSLIRDLERAVGDGDSGNSEGGVSDLKILTALLRARKEILSVPDEPGLGTVSPPSVPVWSVPPLFGISIGTGIVSLSAFPVVWNMASDQSERFTRTSDPEAKRLRDLYSVVGYAALGLGSAAFIASIPVLASSYDPGPKVQLPEGEPERSYFERSLLLRSISYAEKSADAFRTGIIVSLGTGVLSLAGMGVSLWLGQGTFDAYKTAKYSSDARVLRDNLERWRIAAAATGIIGSAGLGCAALLAFMNPDLPALHKRLDELDRRISANRAAGTGGTR